MTLDQFLLELEIYSIRVMFKRVESSLYLILWEGKYPIAHIVANQNHEYRLNYPHLEKIPIIDKMGISGLIIDFANTPVNQRGLADFC